MTNRPSHPAAVARLRSLCFAPPGVEERLSHGEPTSLVRGRSFAMTAYHHHDLEFPSVTGTSWRESSPRRMPPWPSGDSAG
jgi:hypothetical protein